MLAITIAGGAVSAEPFFQPRNIFPLVGKHTHGSSIVECPNGDLLACWFHGSGERTADDVVVNGARLKKGASEWSPMFLMADTPGFPDCNPALYVDRHERVWLFWIAVQAHRWECCLLKYRRADSCGDAGPPDWTWQDVIMLKPGEVFASDLEAKFEELGVGEGMWGEYAPPYAWMLIDAAQDPYKRQTGWMTRIHPYTLPSGRILLPLYSDGFNVSLVALSDDDGDTWRASRPIVGLGPTQPTFVRKKDGTIVAYLRDSGAPPNRVQISLSQDDGESWSASVDTDIPNPDSSLEVVALKDGRWLMVCNDTEEGRRRLTALMSDDEGATWKWRSQIEPCDDIGQSFGYPSVIQARDGLIHMTYSYTSSQGNCIRHTVINPEWIEHSQP
ncbi:MAG: exo-alpha-sialidase [Candidatus Hydrogenedentes bacterium]|nr:exo-alpha-sialidase [Candidatus Hydrogenedentota bacterium]